MVGIVFFAMFSGSLIAVTLVFSGWPLWLALVAYLGCGILGLVMIVVAEFFRPALSRLLGLNASCVAIKGFERHAEGDYIQAKQIPALSDCQLTTNSH